MEIPYDGAKEMILVWLKTFFRHDEHNVSMALAYLSA